MPTVNARKHVIPTGTEQSISRATIFEVFGNSIRDIVAVGNTTERTQLVADLTAKNQGPAATRPLVVYRGDARGLHRLEYTTDGTVWLPASGVPEFATKAAADSFGTANGGLLTTGDRCRVGSVGYVWQGAAWRLAAFTQTARVATPAMTPSTPATVITMNLPADAPAGTYEVAYTAITDATSVNSRYHQVTWAGAELTNWAADNIPSANGGLQASDTLTKTGHAGGAAEIKLILQINATSPVCRMARLTVTYVGP